MSTVFPMHRAVVPLRSQPRALRPASVIELGLRAADMVVVVATAFLAGLIVDSWPISPDHGLFLVPTALLALIVFSALDFYEIQPPQSIAIRLGRLIAAWLATLACGVMLLFVMRPEALPARDWLLAWSVVSGCGLVGVRLTFGALIDRLRAQGTMGWHVVVLGSGDWGQDARRRLDGDQLESTVVGYLDVGDFADLSGLEGVLRQQLAAKGVDQVAVALEAEDLHRLPDLLSLLRQFPVEVGLLPQLGTSGLPTLGYRRLGELTSVTCLKKPIDGWSWHLKTAFDRVAASLLLLFLAPLLGLIALAVKATSPGPIFFRQARLGFNQQPIQVFKFRSMYVDLCDTTLSTQVRQATRDDPRVTRVGAVLRRTSLDELPQLINVLRGEMSLVGPRPHAVAHDEYYASLIDGYLGRHRAKPGITGWAQVRGCRGEIHSLEDMRRRIELDLHYIDNWSLWFDVKILLRTVMVFLRDDKAY